MHASFDSRCWLNANSPRPSTFPPTHRCGSPSCARQPNNTCCCWWPTISPGMTARGGGSLAISTGSVVGAPGGPDVGVQRYLLAPSGPDTTEADLDYWRAIMADPPEPLELPGPAGTAMPTNWRAARSTLRLSGHTVQRVAAIARKTGCTPYMVLVAAFGVLVHRYTHSDDFLVATPVLNRHAETDDAIGYFGNTVVLRLRARAG